MIEDLYKQKSARNVRSLSNTEGNKLLIAKGNTGNRNIAELPELYSIGIIILWWCL